MWLHLNNAFLSIVADKNCSSNLYVRGRVRGDIQRVFPDAKVIATPTNADYAFRASIPRQTVMGAVATSLLEIDYVNFKDSVAEKDRHDAYFDCWLRMTKFQTARQRVDIIERSAPKKGAKRAKGKATAPASIDGWPLMATREERFVPRGPIRAERGRILPNDSSLFPGFVHGDEE